MLGDNSITKFDSRKTWLDYSTCVCSGPTNVAPREAGVVRGEAPHDAPVPDSWWSVFMMICRFVPVGFSCGWRVPLSLHVVYITCLHLSVKLILLIFFLNFS